MDTVEQVAENGGRQWKSQPESACGHRTLQRLCRGPMPQVRLDARTRIKRGSGRPKHRPPALLTGSPEKNTGKTVEHLLELRNRENADFWLLPNHDSEPLKGEPLSREGRRRSTRGAEWSPTTASSRCGAGPVSRTGCPYIQRSPWYRGSVCRRVTSWKGQPPERPRRPGGRGAVAVADVVALRGGCSPFRARQASPASAPETAWTAPPPGRGGPGRS